MATVEKVGSEFLVNSETANAQTAPTIASLAGGGFVMTWQDESHTLGDSDGASVKAQIFDAAGARVGSEFLVNANTADSQELATVTGLAGGGFVVTWQDRSGDASGLAVKAQIYTSLGATVGSEFLVNTQTNGAQLLPVITGLLNGGFAVSWQDQSGTLGDSSSFSIKTQVFTATGATVGGEVLVNTQTLNGQTAPAVGALKNGAYVVAWQDASGTLGDASGTSIKAQIVDADGTKLGSEILINTETTGNQGAPTITGLAGGRFVVSWQDESGTLGDASGTSIKAQIFNAAGVKVGTEFLINSETGDFQEAPTITALSTGGFVVSWTDYSGTLGDSDFASIKAQAYTVNGLKVGGEVLVNTQTSDYQELPTIAGLTNGNFVVGWQDFSGTLGDFSPSAIKAQIFSVAVDTTPPTLTIGAQSNAVVEAGAGAVGVGTPTATIALAKADEGGGPTTFDAAGWTVAGSGKLAKTGTYGSAVLDTATGVLSYTLDNFRAATEALAAGASASDGFSIKVTDGSGLSVTKTASFAVTGSADASAGGLIQKLGGEVLVNTQISNSQVAPSISGLTNGGYVMVWQDESERLGDGDGSSIKAQIFDALGTKMGGEFLVNTAFIYSQTTPGVAGLVNGTFVVTWVSATDSDGLSINGQLFSGSGAKIGDEFGVNTVISVNQVEPVVTALRYGGFAVSWTDVLTSNIKSQVFNASGGKVGDELLVNTSTAGTQNTPAIAGLANGDFVVVWTDESGTLGDSSGTSIKGQFVNSLGYKIGSEFLVNTQTLFSQRDATVTALANGNFVVSWRDVNVDAIKAQVFDASGNKAGFEFTVNTNQDYEFSPTIAALSNGGFVVSWEDTSGTLGDRQGSSVKAQVYGATGTRVGGEFLVNTNTLGQQSAPTVAGLTNGTFVIGWQDGSGTLGDDFDTSIKAQMFGVDTIAPTLTVGAQSNAVVEAGTAGPGTATATIALVAADNGGRASFSAAGWTAAGAGKLAKVGTYGSAVLDTATGVLTYTLDNARLATEALFAGVSVIDAFDIAVNDAVALSVTKTASFLITGSTDGAAGVTITGTAGNDTISTTVSVTGQPKATAFADTINGLAGADSMAGGAGDDIYIVDNAGDTVIESANGGNDTVRTGLSYTLSTNVENLELLHTGKSFGTGNALANIIAGNGSDNTLRGLAGTDTLIGNGGNDALDGGTEADAMFGGIGNDIYSVDNTGDAVTEFLNEGIDTVQTGLSYTLGANVENLTLLFNGKAWGLGNDLDNVITGNIGDNVLRGFGGNDTLNGYLGGDAMTGGIGNDIYVVDNAGDTVTELGNEGTDTVQTGMSYTLGANVENLTLLYNGKSWAFGNELGNTIIGNISDNVLRGMAGNDTLTGGLGADAFVFNTPLNASTNVDQITDFNTTQNDVFWLDDAAFKALSPGALQAGDFVAGTAAANTAQNVVYDSATGSLFFDADGAGGAAQVKFASVTPGIGLTANNFLVI